ncbi:Sperm-tail PG-rich repeat-containing protein 2 [Hondaea fermentalgiana]|uniref:Sperm-tail PG-rich repeat-containing protein 2 n=1 Tax=Hondaea fermentalgiana TaxID=2315210 RepID=A0A2R5G7W1_9STRA|nr:Sperm-tail PG-rich repeat-containing protein 2 [Hondaea fermentalgiana]|eukprot:GBG27127.1 Sperm-tail PG-rich repeat-containing protein 2 [Hondaea fermentalgiana]
MAFVHRTTRETCRIDGFVPETNCTQDIGPGHYDVETGTAMLRDRTKASSRAPFLSTSLRDTPQRGKVNLGPGEYYDATKRPETLGVGCQGAFKSRTKRFQDSNRDKASMPAPGQYEVCQSPPARPQKVKDFGRDTEIFAAFDHETTAPSIPAGDLSHGYVVDSEESAGENQHACALLNPTLADFVRPSLHSSFASTSQRTSGAPKAAAEMPGPGQYAIHELSSKQWIKGSPNVRAKGFGSTSSRFNDPACKNDDDEFGGPDFMPPKSSFVDTWQRASTAQQVHRPGVGFCSSSARIPESKKATEGPGIGNYRLPGMVDDLMLNLATGPKRKKAPFGSSSCRFRRAPAKVQKDDTEQEARLRAIERRRQYNLSDAASSFLKPTYNLSIAVEEEQALRRLGYLP